MAPPAEAPASEAPPLRGRASEEPAASAPAETRASGPNSGGQRSAQLNTIIDRSLVIGQAMACRLPADRIQHVAALHAAEVERVANKDPVALKLRDDMIRIGREDEQKLETSRCDVIEIAFSGLEKLLTAARD